MAKELYGNYKKSLTAEERIIEEKNELQFSDCWIQGKVIDTKYYKQLCTLEKEKNSVQATLL